MTDLTEDQSSPSMVLAQPAHEEHHPEERSYQSQASDFDDFWCENHSISRLPVLGKLRVAKPIRQTGYRGNNLPAKHGRGIPRASTNVQKDAGPLQPSGLLRGMQGLGQEMLNESMDVPDNPPYSFLGHAAHTTPSCDLPSQHMIRLDDHRLETHMSPGDSIEDARTEYYAQRPAQTYQSCLMPVYHGHPNEPIQMEVPVTEAPPPANFISWAQSQGRLEGSPGEISNCRQYHKVPGATDEEWYQQYRAEEPPVEHGQHPKTHPALGSSEPVTHRIKCLENQTQRGRYINSSDAAARGPYTCTSGCGINFARKADWRRHEDNNFPLEEWTCTICSQRITRRDKMKSHLKIVHKKHEFTVSDVSFRALPDVYNRRCRHCGSTFPKLAEFYNHAVVHFVEGKMNSSSPARDEVEDTVVSEDEIETGLVPRGEHVGHNGNAWVSFEKPPVVFRWLQDGSDQAESPM